MSSTLSTLSKSDSKIPTMAKSNETLAARMRRSREEAGLTQESLAKAANISAAAIGLIEIGATKAIKSENVFPLARALGKNPEWLATGAGPESAHAGIENALAALPLQSQVQIADYLQFHLQRVPITDIAAEERARYESAIKNTKDAAQGRIDAAN